MTTSAECKLAEGAVRRRQLSGDDLLLDQAAGLRRMFARRATQSVAFVPVTADAGDSDLLLHTAASLAEGGSSVLLLDEQAGERNLGLRLGLHPKQDLAQVIRGELSLPDVMSQITPLVSYVSAIKLARHSSQVKLLPDVVRSRLRFHLRNLQDDAEFVLVNAAEARGARISSLAMTAEHLTLLVNAHSAAITQAYALIKRLSLENGYQRFQIVFMQVRTETEAKAIFANMQQLAQRQLGVILNHLATVPSGRPGRIAQALRSRLPRPLPGRQAIDGDWSSMHQDMPAEEGQFAIR